MNREAAEEFTAALGLVIGGAVRLADWAPTVDIPAALGLSTDDWVQRRLTGQVKLTRVERQAIVQANPDVSSPKLAGVLGVSDQTILNDRAAASKPLETEPGQGQVTPRKTSDEPKDLESSPHVTRNSGNDEWYTPAPYIDAARDVLGTIDLDPASSDIANEVVRARRFHTIDDDGLARDWQGHVWMNPPYSTGLVERFVSKLLDAYDTGAVPAAIALTNNATETRWWQALGRRSAAVCMLSGRIKFRSATGEVAGAGLQGQTIAYLGADPDTFAKRFAEFGVVL